MIALTFLLSSTRIVPSGSLLGFQRSGSLVVVDADTMKSVSPTSSQKSTWQAKFPTSYFQNEITEVKSPNGKYTAKTMPDPYDDTDHPGDPHYSSNEFRIQELPSQRDIFARFSAMTRLDNGARVRFLSWSRDGNSYTFAYRNHIAGFTESFARTLSVSGNKLPFCGFPNIYGERCIAFDPILKPGVKSSGMYYSYHRNEFNHAADGDTKEAAFWIVTQPSDLSKFNLKSANPVKLTYQGAALHVNLEDLQYAPSGKFAAWYSTRIKQPGVFLANLGTGKVTMLSNAGKFLWLQ